MVSSQNIPVKDLVTDSGRSLINTKYNKAARTVPCGRPDKTSTNLDFTPSITTLCFLSDRKSRIHGNAIIVHFQ